MAGGPNTLEDLADHSTCMRFWPVRSLGQEKLITHCSVAQYSHFIQQFCALIVPAKWVSTYCKTQGILFQQTHFVTSFKQQHIQIVMIELCICNISS